MLATIECGMPSSPLACNLKWATAKITSLAITGLNENPSVLAVDAMLKDSMGSSRGDTEMDEKMDEK